MDLGLKNKVAIVTGASKGIGAACAEILAAEGAKVVLVARTTRHLDPLAKRLSKRYRTEVAFVSADMGVRGSADHVAEEVLRTFGRIDILINSAGSSQGGMFWEVTDDTWDSAVQLKFLGAVRMVRAVLPTMRRQKYGRIVNVAGNTGRQPHPRLLPGSTTNAALLSFTKGLSEEIMKDGVFINALQPGPTETEHWGTLMANLSRGTGLSPKAFEKEFMKEIPMRRVAAAIEMARPIIFMASDLASYMTGRSIIVDGGWTKDLA
ncbi:MAG: SDR family oxidoreductase [Alphaproteobacteria bacterium]|nr:SDR family oxidoreductase [Alphaproteobacteria bacterium]